VSRHRQLWSLSTGVAVAALVTVGMAMPASASASAQAILHPLPELAQVTAVAVGTQTWLALESNGEVFSSGPAATFTRVPNLTTAVAIGAGGRHFLALTTDGTVWAWGSGGYGLLGQGTLGGNSTVPLKVKGIRGKAVAIAAGTVFNWALMSDGTVEGWGSNQSGALGTGIPVNANATIAIPVEGITGAVAISAGNFNPMALRADDTVETIGVLLGNGSFGISTTPVIVPGVSGVTQVWAGGYADYVLLSDGTIESWGSNTYGQLGDGTTTASAVPVHVHGLSGVAKVSGRDFIAYALMPDGTINAWGSAAPFFTSTLPVAVTGLPKVSALNGVGGKFFSIAAFRDGTAALFQP
jgi:alpha-tubulin suppressor-like RCC1 family protein